MVFTSGGEVHARAPVADRGERAPKNRGHVFDPAKPATEPVANARLCAVVRPHHDPRPVRHGLELAVVAGTHPDLLAVPVVRNAHGAVLRPYEPSGVSRCVL